MTEAAAEVERAREALREAEASYQQVCDQAAEGSAQPGRLTLGEAIDGSLEFVRRHPVSGLCGAGILGYLVGRWLRR